MELIPGSGKIQFFRSLANSAQSGLSPMRALEIMAGGQSAVPRAVVADLMEQLRLGRPFSEGLRAHPDDFPLWQAEIVRVGEENGRLDSSCRTIAEMLEERRSFILNLLPGFAYPMLVLHFAPFAFYAPMLIQGAVGSFAFSVVRFLLCFYVPAGLAAWYVKTRSPESLARLPVMSTVAKMQFSMHLSALVRAAVPLDKALSLAAAAGGLAPPGSVGAAERGGASVVSRLRDYDVFSSEELARIEVAEASGTIDEALAQIAAQSRERWQTALKAAGAVLPAVIYLLIALVIAYRIVSFYSGYNGQLDQLMHGG